MKHKAKASSKTTIHVIKSTIKEEGIRAVPGYVIPPLIANSIIGSTLFFVYGTSLKTLHEKENHPKRVDHILFSGALAGFAQSFISCPVDITKLHFSLHQKESFIQSFRDILSTEGLRGMYRNFPVILARDIVGWSAFFTTYESCRNFMTPYEKKIHKGNSFSIVVSGGLAGVVYQLVNYPIDVLTAESIANPSTYSGYYDCVKQIIKQEGIRYFFQGISLSRVWPASAVAFLAFEFTLKESRKKNN